MGGFEDDGPEAEAEAEAEANGEGDEPAGRAVAKGEEADENEPNVVGGFFAGACVVGVDVAGGSAASTGLAAADSDGG